MHCGTVETESIIPRSFVQHAALTPDLSLSNTTHGGARHARGLIQTVFKCGKRTCFPFMYLIFNECNEWSFLDSNYNIVWRRVAWSLTRPMGRVGSGRIGSENLEGCAGRVGSGPDGLGTQILRHKFCLVCISCRIWHCIMLYIILMEFLHFLWMWVMWLLTKRYQRPREIVAILARLS